MFAYKICQNQNLITFESEPRPTSADAYWELTTLDAGHQEVGRCSTIGRSQGIYITFTFTKVNKAEPILALLV